MFVHVNIKSMTRRTAYHHGDLRNALVAAAVELAEQGGPDAVTIRAAARLTGVTPTAAYRHFAGHPELLHAARVYSLDSMGEAMRKRLARLPPEPDVARAAMARIEAMGRGYVDFALSQPGLFRTAFCREAMESWEHPDLGDGPHAMLVEGVGELIELGFVREELRMGAEISAWSLVHGLALLLLEGPLAQLPEVEQVAVVDQTMSAFLGSFWAARASTQDPWRVDS
jgi:AcrR family transcriptional regulator